MVLLIVVNTKIHSIAKYMDEDSRRYVYWLVSVGVAQATTTGGRETQLSNCLHPRSLMVGVSLGHFFFKLLTDVG